MLKNLEWIPLVEHYKLPSASGLYLIRGPSGKLYAGQSKNIRKRLSDHRYSGGPALARSQKSTKISRAIRKYGVGSFSVSVYLLTEPDKLNELEVKLIASLDLQRSGYNITAGGEGSTGVLRSKAYLEKLSLRRKGVKTSDETKRRIRESCRISAELRRGVPRSADTCAKMSAGRTGKVFGPRGPMSEVNKLKISNARKGQHAGGSNPKAKVVLYWPPESFTPMIFPCGRDLARFLGKPYKSVSAWCSGQYRSKSQTVCCYA